MSSVLSSLVSYLILKNVILLLQKSILIFSCSLACYKTHKETCAGPAKKNPDDETNTAVSAPASASLTNELLSVGANLKYIEKKTSDLATANLRPEGLDLNEIASDFVPQEKLQLLGDSDKLKNLLSNKHLRNLMVDVNEQDVHVDKKMEKLMQEPLFQEFSNVCLNILQ